MTASSVSLPSGCQLALRLQHVITSRSHHAAAGKAGRLMHSRSKDQRLPYCWSAVQDPEELAQQMNQTLKLLDIRGADLLFQNYPRQVHCLDPDWCIATICHVSGFK